MKIIPESHTGEAILPHDETFEENNLLSRGQTIRDLDTSTATDMPLEPGQMSIHHNKTIHSSEPNNADWPRVGFAIRYALTRMKKLRPWLDHGFLELDAERSMRPIALGRKNYLFMGSGLAPN